MRFLIFNIKYLSIKKYFVSFLLLSLVYTVSFAQFNVPQKPKLQTSIYDYIELLSSSEKHNLEQKLIRYSDTTSTQIVIAIINSTEGENINYLGAKWGQEWGIGQEKEDNGILILLAKNDRKIAIHTGYGVEHLLTDAMSKRIIERDIIPYFKQTNYYGGLNSGSDAIFEVLNGEYHSTKKATNEFPIGLIFILIFIFIIILISISNNKRGGSNNKGNRSTGTDILEAIILSNMGRGNYKRGSSGWGGNSGGFGGGGFGGGGFGGGGASGSW